MCYPRSILIVGLAVGLSGVASDDEIKAEVKIDGELAGRSGGHEFGWTKTSYEISQELKNCTTNNARVCSNYPEISCSTHISERRRRATSLTIERENRIVGGGQINIKDFPWVVSLQVHNSHVCGGSIILADWVLTASHCTHVYDQPSDWLVLASSSNSNDKSIMTQQRTVLKIIDHPEFSIETYTNDITLMKLNSKLDYSAQVQPVCIPSKDEHGFTTEPETFTNEMDSDLDCFVAGYGTIWAGGPASGSLRAVNVPQIGRTQCNNWFKSSTGGLAPDWVLSNMICAGYEEGKLDGCQGDSGGPLSCVRNTQTLPDHENELWYMSGIVSWGIDCAQEKMPGVYTKVILYYNWIWDNIADNI